MPTTFDTLWRELSDQVPKASAALAKKWVNRAWLDVLAAHKWSFLYARTIIHIPPAVTAGAVAVEQFSPFVTFDATATAALDALTMFTPVTGYQIQIDGTTPYNITDYTPVAGTATITPALPTADPSTGWQGATTAAASYILLKCYFAPPSTDFLRWVSVVNTVVPYKFWTGVPVSRVDLYDPKRIIIGNPYVITQMTAGVNPADGSEAPMYELWPHATEEMNIVAVFEKQGVEFVGNDEELPAAIPADLVLERARYRCYEWCNANQGRFPELRGVSWTNLMVSSNAEYRTDLHKYAKLDRETFSNATITFSNMGYYGGWPMWDSNYTQISSLAADYYTGNFGWPV